MLDQFLPKKKIIQFFPKNKIKSSVIHSKDFVKQVPPKWSNFEEFVSLMKPPYIDNRFLLAGMILNSFFTFLFDTAKFG
jgi:hypothetical protein